MEDSKIDLLEEKIDDLRKTMAALEIDPQVGLTEPLFLFASSLTPLVNVDLLIRDAEKGVLLAWRDEKYNGKGWHIPGGIIRLKETVDERIQKTAVNEIGTEIVYNSVPLMVQEDICTEKRDWLEYELERSNNMSMLYDCRLPEGFEIKPQGREVLPGNLKWFDHYPENLLKCHEKLYGVVLESIFRGDRYDSEIQI